APGNDEALNALFPGVPLLPAATEATAPQIEEEPMPDSVALPEMEDEPDVDDDPEFVDDIEPPKLPAAILMPTLPPVALLEENQWADRKSKRPKSPRREI